MTLSNPVFLLALWICLLLGAPPLTLAYRSGVPPVDRRALAGLWKLTPQVRSIKEFTVHPRKPPKKKPDEVLLMLKEDGSFTRYEISTEESDDETEQDIISSAKTNVDQSWKQFVKDQQSNATTSTTTTANVLFKGTWDYRNGELILAADRDEQKLASDFTTNSASNKRQQQNLFYKHGKDTILVGAVVATTPLPFLASTNKKEQTTSTDNPQQEQPSSLKSSIPKSKSTSNPDTASTTTKLSVPMGSVQVGKFFYPKNHPSFFDQPIYQPGRVGTFQLQQVLGNSAPVQEDEQLVEKFRNKDFHNKRFFLTTHPMEPRRPKGNIRWSIKYNKFVEDPPSKEAQQQHEAAQNRMVSQIRVLKVVCHANNTFSTVAGMGDTSILRGRYYVIGDQRDQFWMQTLRFGFGRSVSGSTYSEGQALGEETKSYWGKISYQEDDDVENGKDDSIASDTAASNVDDDEMPTVDDTPQEDDEKKRLQIKGSVIVGWGLEPQPVARFIMKEADEDEADFFEEYNDEDDEEEEEEDEMDDTNGMESQMNSNDDDQLGEDGLDDTWSGGEAFQ